MVIMDEEDWFMYANMHSLFPIRKRTGEQEVITP